MDNNKWWEDQNNWDHSKAWGYPNGYLTEEFDAFAAWADKRIKRLEYENEILREEVEDLREDVDRLVRMIRTLIIRGNIRGTDAQTQF